MSLRAFSGSGWYLGIHHLGLLDMSMDTYPNTETSLSLVENCKLLGGEVLLGVKPYNVPQGMLRVVWGR